MPAPDLIHHFRRPENEYLRGPNLGTIKPYNSHDCNNNRDGCQQHYNTNNNIMSNKNNTNCNRV